MFRIRKLKRRITELQDELYDLHNIVASEAYYMQRRAEIEYEIACIEESIELETNMLPMKYTLYGFIVVACALLVWAYVESK
jgi:hypothetical protein